MKDIFSKESVVSSQLRHGHVFSPPSRAYYAFLDGKLDEGAMNQRECGKFFPHTEAGLQDPIARDDVVNFAPPPDGKIASANQATGEFLDEAGRQWKKNNVDGSKPLEVSWHYSAAHVTRRWNYFITKADWDPDQVLTREQFEPDPIYQDEHLQQPYWSFGDELTPESPTITPCPYFIGPDIMFCWLYGKSPIPETRSIR